MSSGRPSLPTIEWRSSNRFATTGPRSADTLSSDFEELFAFFNARRVRAVVVGGHALAFHGHPRFRKNRDVFVDAAGRPQDLADITALE